MKFRLVMLTAILAMSTLIQIPANAVDKPVIEVWALPEINKKHVEDLLVNIQKFEFVDWTPKSQKKIAFHEISEFWLSKSGAQRNLFLS